MPNLNQTNRARNVQLEPTTLQRISQSVADSDRAFRSGDFEISLRLINEAARLLPNDPGILLRRARLFEVLQQPDKASGDYAAVSAIPDLPEALRSQSAKRANLLNNSTP